MDMRNNLWLLFLLLIDQQSNIHSLEDQPCCESWTKDGWYELGLENLEEPLAVCENGVTKTYAKKGQTILIYFQPTNQYGVVGISACTEDGELNDCYVADIFGLIYGRLGYWWRKHSRARAPDESGESQWVPGREEELPSTVLQNETALVTEEKLLGTFHPPANIKFLWKTFSHRKNGLWSPKPGKTVSELRSPILNTGSSRLQVCVSLVGLVSEWGASISVFVTGNSEEVLVGKLVHNGVNPPEWQRVRVSVTLPSALQNVPLVLKLVFERTASSLVLLREAKLCSYDGCGLPTVEGIAQIAYGQRAPLAKYPWHVAIFRNLDGKAYIHICGGSLVRSDVVISAAHCFFNEDRRLDKSKFKLAVGKIYNVLHIYEKHQQFGNAIEIFIPDRYKGDTANFVYDIAVILVRFNTSSIILPVCLDWSNRALPSLQVSHTGEVAGWGRTQNNTESKELLFASLPYIPYNKCAATVPESFLRYVTPDKFCAGNINGQSVRKGDSGGGLVFKTGGLWYLRGVVSTGVPSVLTYSTFTDISQFISWIKEVLHISEDS